MRVPYVLVLGDKEEEKKTLAVRHNGKVEYGVDVKKFIEKLREEIGERK